MSPPDYEPESEDVVNDQDKFVPRRAPPPKETADVVAAPSGDASDTGDTIPTPMDTSETEEKEEETDKTEPGDQPMTEAIPEAETPQEKEGMEVVESQAAEEITATEKGTSVTSVTSERPKEKTVEKQSKKPKTRRKATPLYADVGDRATLLR